jgi:uncharacterized Zn finger protein
MDWLNGHVAIECAASRLKSNPRPPSKEAFMWWSYKPYVSVAQRQAKAARELKKLEKTGHKAQPVHIEGKKIAQTFWGKAWCDNLESYSDFENRLPRGRSYVRNGSVCDLQIEPGRVTAMVCGSELYKIKIGIKRVEPKLWSDIKRECAGQIGSLIELLQGKLSQRVMEIITRRDEKGGSGLFPKPAEIELDCSCPDWADMCKHVAAALYGVGARLDEKPELLFVLRQVDHLELISQAGDIKALTKGKRAEKTIAADALSDVFGIELEAMPGQSAPTTQGKEQKIKPRKKADLTDRRSAEAVQQSPATPRRRRSKPARSSVV